MDKEEDGSAVLAGVERHGMQVTLLQIQPTSLQVLQPMQRTYCSLFAPSKTVLSLTLPLQVTQGDWHELLEPAVREDLRKHRSYRGRSIRDLLRAIRNKKHHYRELTESARALYGQMPGQFCDYWTTRFPRLLLHSYKAMQCCK